MSPGLFRSLSRFVCSRSIRANLLLLVAGLLTSLMGLAILAMLSIHRIKVTGALYEEIRDGKDVIADVLPPPMFLTESMTLVYQMHLRATEMQTQKVATLPTDLKNMERELSRLRAGFEVRHAHWDKHLKPGPVRDELLGDVSINAREFFEVATGDFTKAAYAQDDAALDRLTNDVLRPLFERHLFAVRKVVADAEQWTAGAEAHASQQVALYQRLFIGISIVSILVVLIQSDRVMRNVMRPIDRLTASMTAYMKGDSPKRASIDVSDNEVAIAAIAFNQLADVVNAKSLELGETITRLKQTETNLILQAHELDRALTQAKAASQAKGDFLANMSHELRTPLTAILGFAGLLESGDSQDEIRQEHLQTIRRNAEHLLALIGNILDISRIESGAISLERRPIELIETCRHVLSTFQAAADKKSIALVLDVSGPIPQQFTGDPTALRQVLINLVGNAVKFTSQGSVTLQVQIGSTELPSLEFHVIDTGPGMTQEQQDRLFKPFIQADNSITRKYGGTGLGLAISQKLAGLMEGKITLASQPGQGTTFSFHLPISTFDADSASAAITNPTAPPPMMIGSFDAKPLTGLRILYADDMPDNRALLKHLLGKLGATPTVVDGGQAAIDLVRTGSTFDIILLDVQMPDLNGYDTTRALRQMGSTLPIFALTAHALPEDRQRCLAAGCDDYLTKPVDVSKLVAACLARTNTNKQAA